MCFVHKLIKRTRKSEDGFVLLVAIMAIVILIAIGFFALTMISGDIMITSRLVGESKAFSAAESGVHAILASPNSLPATNTTITGSVDSVNDPSASYTATTSMTNQDTRTVGNEITETSRVFNALVTGRDSIYGSEAQISVGIAGAPRDSSTTQGKL